jgi:hypothetical protein
MSYADSLSRELSTVGISGRLRQRIVLEIEDHLACDPKSDLGDPRSLARRFADELGTARARRAALYAFAALAVAGTIFAAVFLSVGATGPRLAKLHPESRLLAAVAAVLAVLGCQVAFAAGIAAGLRAWRLRRDVVLARAEATVIGRRATVAVISGVVTMVGLAGVAIELRHGLTGWVRTFAIAGAGASACVLLAAGTAVLGAARLRPVTAGPAGDMFEDIGPFVPPILDGRPWRFALVLAIAIAIAIAVVGVLSGDPYDGIARGLADGLACLGGFWLLGRYLSLR